MNQQKKTDDSWVHAIFVVLLMIISALAGSGVFYFMRMDGFTEALIFGMLMSAFSATILIMIFLKSIKNKKKD